MAFEILFFRLTWVGTVKMLEFAQFFIIESNLSSTNLDMQLSKYYEVSQKLHIYMGYYKNLNKSD